ncbi:MAG: TonB-dependent receptor [Gammaproteobacteria bacterium]|nr:TonB-dependent receptor [Gammaproteobacteria bacterium]
MKITRHVFLVALATSFTLPTLAEEPSPIIVTATRTAQTADETIAPVIIIDRSIIESNPNAAVSDLLRIHAGIDIARSGGQGQQTSIFIRGTESNHTLVLLDGVKINPGTLGVPAIQNIDLNMVERIELVKGPRSTLYGSDAIGGVINIITRKGTEGSQYKIKAGYGSYNTKTLGFSAHNKVDDRAAGISVNTTKTDGYAIRTTSPIKRGYENINIHLYGKKKIGKADVKIAHWLSNGKTEYLDFSLNPVDQNYENATTSIDITSSFADNWLSKVKISRSLDEIIQNHSADFAKTQRDVLDWQNDIQLSENQLVTAGIYLSNENARASVFGSSFNVDTQVSALFVQDDIQIGQHHIIAGIRYTNHETFDNHNTGSLDYSWQLTKPLRITLGIATGFRSPDSTERFSGTSANPNLLPEESINKEMGVHYDISKQQKLRLSHFQNDITNLIEYDGGTTTMQNISEAQISGTEIEYQFKSDSWAFSAGAVLQRPENKATGIILSRRSEASYTLGINHYKNNFNIGLDILHAGERDNSAYDSIKLKSYTLANMNTKYQATKHLSINARIENLTDELYELAGTYRTPERSYFIDLEYSF